MKQYYKEFKSLKAVNGYLKKIDLEGFTFDCGEDYFKTAIKEFDHDAWDVEGIEGVSVQVEWMPWGIYEVRVTKYTKKDIED